MSAVQSQDNMLITSSRLRTIQTVLWTPLTVSTSVRDATRSIIGKKLGLKVVSEKLTDRGRVYRIG